MTIYRAVQRGQLRAARIGGRRELRFLASWIDSWLVGQETKQPGSGLAAGGQISPPFVVGTATQIGEDWR